MAMAAVVAVRDGLGRGWGAGISGGAGCLVVEALLVLCLCCARAAAL